MTSSQSTYRHVVLFKFKEKTPHDSIRDIENAFLTLCNTLSCVKAFEWGRNSSPENLNMGFTHCFLVTFASAQDRDIYLPHPAHQAFCSNYLDPHLEKVCVVDFAPT